MAREMAHDVFISHSARDKPHADAVCAKLESQGMRCWIAPRDIHPGMEYGAAIVEAIDGARVMLLVFSSHSNTSPQISREIERAVHKELIIVPIRIEDVAPSGNLEYFLATPHWLDAITPPFEQHLDEVASSVGFWLRNKGSDSLADAPAPKSFRPPNPPIAPRSLSGVLQNASKSQRIGVALVLLLIFATSVVLGIRGYEGYAHRRALAKGDAVVDSMTTKVRLGTAPELLGTPEGASVDAIRDASESRDPAQERRMGFLYRFGLGVPKSAADAFSWTSKAAIQGDAQAQDDLGMMYENGAGIESSYSEALRWFRMAAAQGYAPAEAHLGTMYAMGWGLQQDDSEAVQWYRKAADQNDASGENYLGWMYGNGRGVIKDDAEALNWCRKSAAQGFAIAEANLGKMYQKGSGVDKNYAEAVKWYRLAAMKGYGWAESNLGEMYENGWGVDKDLGQAIDWYKKAAAHGEREGTQNLARLQHSP
jgi:TPR repeat protein